MNKPFLYAAMAVCLAASCKKSENNQLVGTWRLIEFAGDDNGNKIMDSSEITKAATGPMSTCEWTLKSGGDIDVVWADVMDEGTWKLKSGGDELQLALRTRTNIYKLVTLDNNVMVTAQEGNNYITWRTFVKQ